MPDEIFDIVNEQDQVVGQAPRDEVHLKELLHRASVALFIQGQNAVVQRRSKAQDNLPGFLTYTVGGHVNAGETYEETVLREGREEVGWNMKKDRLSFVAKVKDIDADGYFGKTHYVFHHVYVYDFEGKVEELKPQTGEVDEFFVVPLKDLFNPPKGHELSPRILEPHKLEAIKKFLEKRGMHV